MSIEGYKDWTIALDNYDFRKSIESHTPSSNNKTPSNLHNKSFRTRNLPLTIELTESIQERTIEQSFDH